MGDTIFALATARGKAGVAVVRVSGSEAWDAAEALAGDLPPVRQAVLRGFRDRGELIDNGLLILFEKGQSFTGERVAEFQLHGSVAVVKRLLATLSALGYRSAEPGEFTRRALENGRLDLTQVEGLADLIDAETEAQRRQALAVAEGAARDQVQSWRQRLIRAAALIEATIDFADEDVPEDVTPEVRQLIGEVSEGLRQSLAGVGMSERIREGFEVAIIGAPNVGKSTLLNRLAGREAAITSAVAGTTRDVIEVRMELAGLPVTFLDTAGLRETDDVVESIGIARARERAERADLRIFLTLGEAVDEDMVKDGDLVLRAKGDVSVGGASSVSGKTGQGVRELVDRVSEILEGRAAGAGLMSRQRHREAMSMAIGSLESAADRLQLDTVEADLIAEDLRQALRALGSLIGHVDVEHLLDEIFSSFCIGK
ncbi:tRNA uridine-5-carboxymethylaminomethyl(34) synthesis GTPase MnmE [Paracoccus sp. p4-l81]|uniref:tRNA uridine-5-carboxymethylaminomethyl(34) synthesis GTPase MnmE n=1 Tax=Paracoccus sp. p4-l81 TaxID=3342806 RepID=UPI0035BAD141